MAEDKRWEVPLPNDMETVWMDDIEDGQHNQDLEQELAGQVARGERPPLIRIWRSARAEGIAVSRRDLAARGADDAVKALAAEGIEVVVRNTGGTAVPQGPGVIHLSWMLPRERGPATTDAYYRLLCDPLMGWMRQLGLQPETGALPGSYCDGTYNILVDGRKLVGTAQAWRGGLAGVKSNRPGYVLAHASMMVDVDMHVATQRINQFYELSGNPYRVDEATTLTLRERIPAWFGNVGPAEATVAVAESWEEWYQRQIDSRIR